MRCTASTYLFWTMAAGVFIPGMLGCLGSDDNNEVDETPEKVCPFSFPEATATFPQAASVALLNFPVFPDVTVSEDGAEGKKVLYLANANITYTNSDGQPDSSPNIGYIQAFQGTAVLFTPDEVAAEFDRVDNNARMIFNAKTSTQKITLGGDEVNVHIAESETAKIMTVFVPIEDGKLIAPVSVGVYATVSGCEGTMTTVFNTLKSGVTLNAATTYHELDVIKELKAQKLGTE